MKGRPGLSFALAALTGAATLLPVTAATTPEVGTNPVGFPLKFFKEVAKGNTQRNVLVSPYSVSSALTMTYMGAGGSTRQEMASVLGLRGEDEQVGMRANNVINSLRAPGSNTTLEVANGLFASQAAKFNNEFLSLNSKYFGANVTTLNFASPTALATINAFVYKSTHGKIPTIVDRIPPNAMLYLINAIYFKGSWEHRFDKNRTTPGSFHTGNGGIKNVSMMNMRRKDFRYLETNEFQAINLAYIDKRLSLYIFLPKQSSSLDAFEAELEDARWNKWLTQFRSQEGSLSMPRFKIADSMKLKATLKQMGMGTAFDERDADFSAMTNGKELFIQDVIHKTFMEINEEGTEAAAVTAVEMAVKGMAIKPRPFSMVVDRPYFIALRDAETDTLLFVAHVAEPISAD